MIEIDVQILIVELISFLILIAVLWKILYKPITRFLEQRALHIKNTLADIDRGKSDIEKIKKDYQTQLAEIDSRAQSVIQQAVKEAEEVKQKITAEAHEESRAMIEKAQLEIEKEKKRAVRELHKEIATLSVFAASKIIEKSIDEDTAHRLVKECIAETTEENVKIE